MSPSDSPYSAGLSVDEVRRKFHLRRVIKLASNENNWGLPLAHRLRLAAGFLEAHRYPDTRYPDLRTALAEANGLPPERVVIGNGSDEVLDILISRLTKSGDAVVVPTPSFQLYRILLANHGRKCVEVPLAADWTYDLDRILKAVTPKTSMVILCNPNNPTGTWIGRTELEQFLKRVPRRIRVIVDEAYADFACDPEFGAGRPLMDRFPNLVVCRTFSKYFCLAGLRLGYALCPKDVAEIYEKFRPPFSVNKLVEKAGFLVRDKALFERWKAKILSEKERFYREMERLKVPFVRSEANFVFLPGVASAKKVFETLLSRGVIVRELSAFGVKDGLRVTIGRPSENRQFIREFKRALVHGV
jgi:histidinol-phosphate aminotransferase